MTEPVPSSAPDESRRAPAIVIEQACYHAVTGGTALLGVGLLYFFTRHGSLVMSARGYVITLTLALVYLTTGLLVWLGLRPGLYLNYACSLIYLARPGLGLRLWRNMRQPEFREHFRRK
jgi:hypothetical protein